MTQHDGIGEQREKQRRSRFWNWIAAFAGGGFIAGVLSGMVTPETGMNINPVVLLAALAIILLGYTLLSWRFFRSVDELELADNLWAALYGLYFYIAFQPSWWLLHRSDLVPPVDPWAIYFATLSFSFVAYLARKILNR